MVLSSEGRRRHIVWRIGLHVVLLGLHAGIQRVADFGFVILLVQQISKQISCPKLRVTVPPTDDNNEASLGLCSSPLL